MKRFHLRNVCMAGMALVGLSDSVYSEDTPKREVARRPVLERILKEFDKDGSGLLNDEEVAAARRGLERALAEISEKGLDARPETATAESSNQNGARPNLTAILKRFDKDGDGKLSNEEKTAALKPRDGLGMGPGGLGPEGRPNFQEMIKRFDKNGDGQLNEEERAAAREAFARMGGPPGGPGGIPSGEEVLKRFDRDGDGKLNSEEPAAARSAFGQRRRGAAGGALIPGEGKQQEPKLDNEQLLRRFDQDGDGKLSSEEKAAAREALQNRESPTKD